MSSVRTCSALTLSIFLLILTASIPAHAAAAPDANLYTTYSFGTGYQNVYWVVCGSTATTSGCYDSGSMGPFGQAGALIEGNPMVNTATSTVTRYIYIVDTATGTAGNAVTLYVYKKVDVVSSSFDTTTVTLFKTVSLPLTGGSSVVCSMAANNGYLFIGTDQTPYAVRVQKSNLAVTQIGGFSPPINVTSITADKYGFVTVTFGGSFNGGIYLYGPTGQLAEDGGGSDFMLNTFVGLTTNTLPASGAVSPERLHVRPRTETPAEEQSSN